MEIAKVVIADFLGRRVHVRAINAHSSLAGINIASSWCRFSLGLGLGLVRVE